MIWALGRWFLIGTGHGSVECLVGGVREFVDFEEGVSRRSPWTMSMSREAEGAEMTGRGRGESERRN